jgi:hypothetical protein
MDRLRPSNRPGFDEPYEPVVLPARITNRVYERSERGDCLKGWAFHDWLQAEREILGQKTRNADMPHRGGYARAEKG